MARTHSIRLDAHDPRLNHFSEEISTEENAEGRGMLGALVVHKRVDLQPRPRVFERAQRLGHDTGDIVKFWIVKGVFTAWNT